MNGKGDQPRPLSITKQEFDNNWDRIFKKKKQDPQLDALDDFKRVREELDLYVDPSL